MIVQPAVNPRDAFDLILGQLRPKLHRYCARMTGSVIDGEDVVHEAFVKAIEAFPDAGTITHLEGWLFRIAHNAALDALRRRARQDIMHSNDDPEMIVDPAAATDNRDVASTSLRTFMRLPVTQRSSVILMDVLGYSLQEISDVTNASIPAIKSALLRGRVRLRELALEPEEHPIPALSEAERWRIAMYVDRFNARDFDAIRDLLAEDVRLDVVNRGQRNGRREVGSYFHNYALIHDWTFAAGTVEGRPAAIVRDPGNPLHPPGYFILLGWAGDKLATIRDFRFATYIMQSAEFVMFS
jgi:RNA polymerase sigma-70 factor (ECF subfamily)